MIEDISVLDSEDFFIGNIRQKEHNLIIDFEMSFVVEINLKTVVKGTATGNLENIDFDEFPYAKYDWDSMRKNVLQEYYHFLHINELQYNDVEILAEV